MTRFFESVRNNPGTWLFQVIALTWLTGSMVVTSGECLKTTSAPFGIVSLELAFTNETASQIKSGWKAAYCGQSIPMIQIANGNIFKDMIFLVAYSTLFCVGVVLVSKKDFAYARYLVFGAILAGALDAIENIFMLRYLAGDEIHPAFFGVPAFIKFMILVVLTVYIVIALVTRLYQKFKPAAT